LVEVKVNVVCERRQDTSSPGTFWVWFPGVGRVLNIGLSSQGLGDFSADMDEFTAVFLR